MYKFDVTKVPEYALKVARILIKEGFECYLVGGAVRDHLLDLFVENYDFATNATPDVLIKIESFPKAIQINERFGTIAVVVPDEKGENHNVDVTTYRSEKEYAGGRWPSEVKFGVTLEEDLKRRDFTINSIAVDMKEVFSLIDNLPRDNKENLEIIPDSTNPKDTEVSIYPNLIDLFGGVLDLKNKVIRTVGEPMDRFSEDGLRPIRACRLASNKGFTIETKTFETIGKTLHIVKQISLERFRDEFDKILMKSPKPSVGLNLLRDSGILKLFIPELLEGINVNQPKFHVHDVYDHLLACVDVAEDRVKLAALFHDIGKPRCADGNGHFYGHDQVGSQMTREILTRIKYPKDVVERAVKLIESHMFYYPYSNADDPKYSTEEDLVKDRNDKMNQGWKDNAIRRFIKRVGTDNIEDVFRLRIADATCNPNSAWDPTEITRLQSRISKVLEEDNALKITDLDIDGNDLKELGLSGKEIGTTLNMLLEKVIDEPSLNKKDSLIGLINSKKENI